MNNNFVKVTVTDNFYQTSSFYPMPVVMVTTLSDEGLTNIGSYSLCFPFGISENHYMMLISRSSSNTASNIRKNKTASLNFIPYNKKLLKNSVVLGYPGETTAQKLDDSIFTLLPSSRTQQERIKNQSYPKIIEESIQVFECTWDDSNKFHFDCPEQESHFLLKIDKIIMKEAYFDNMTKGKGFPTMPVDFGYRDNNNFWFSKHSKPYSVPIPQSKGIDVNTIIYQADRSGFDVEWEDSAYEKLVKIPRPFIKKAVHDICETAVKEGITLITPDYLDEIRGRRKR